MKIHDFTTSFSTFFKRWVPSLGMDHDQKLHDVFVPEHSDQEQPVYKFQKWSGTNKIHREWKNNMRTTYSDSAELSKLS